MSYRKGKGKSSSYSTDYYPTAWSIWEWDEEERRFRRYRLRAPNEYEIEYDPESESKSSPQFATPQAALGPTIVESTEQITQDRTSCTWPGCEISFQTIAERDRHYQTIHANNGERPHECLVPGCQASVRSWGKADKLRAHNKQWHGPYHCPESGCPRGIPNGFGSQIDLDEHRRKDHGTISEYSVSAYTPPVYAAGTLASQETWESKSSMPLGSVVRAKDPRTYCEKFDPNYKVHRQSEFKWGRVFKTLWSEPKGTSDLTDDEELSSREGRHGETFYEKVRRFVVVNQMQGHCICLPINTYGGQGVGKKGVHAAHHAVIFTGKKPFMTKDEIIKGLGNRPPINVTPDGPRGKLDSMSRLNYAKTYTVEYNVKVWFIGEIHAKSQGYLAADYNDVHPPMMPPSMFDYAITPLTTPYSQYTSYTSAVQDPHYRSASGSNPYSSFTGSSSDTQVPGPSSYSQYGAANTFQGSNGYTEESGTSSYYSNANTNR